MPATLRARTIGSAPAFVRTRTAWSRGRAPGRDPAPDLGRDPVGLVGAGRERLEADRRRVIARSLRAQALVDADPDLESIGIVVADEPVGRVEDRRPGAVVAAEHDDPGAAMAIAELEDVADRRSPEAVDGLVVIADDGDVPVPLREQPDELRLDSVRVLEFVDEDVAEAILQAGPDARRLADETEGPAHLVPEVEIAGPPEKVLVAAEGPGELELAGRGFQGRVGGIALGVGGVVVAGRDGRRSHGGRGHRPLRVVEVAGRGDVLVLQAAEQARQCVEEAGRIAERPIAVELEVEEVLAEEEDHLGPGQDAGRGRQAGLEGELADDPVAERMKGRDRRVREAVRRELVDTEGHLVGRLVGERQGEDLRGTRPAGRDQPGDPPGDDLGLARPRSGDDEERTLAVGDRPSLIRVEPAEQCRDTAIRLLGRGVRDRDVTPDRDLLEAARLVAPDRPPHASSPSAGCDARRRREGTSVATAGRGMARASPTAVPARPSLTAGAVTRWVVGRGRPAPRRCPGQGQCLGLLGRQGPVGPAGGERPGVDPGSRPSVEAADDEAVVVGIEEGEGEALVAARLLERVVADEPGPLERSPTRRLEARRPGHEVVDMDADRDDPLEVGVQDGFEAPPALAPSQVVDPTLEAADPAPHDDRDRDRDDGQDEGGEGCGRGDSDVDRRSSRGRRV